MKTNKVSSKPAKKQADNSNETNLIGPDAQQKKEFQPRNLVVLTGNLGKDPQLMTSQKGKPRAFFTLATNHQYWENGKPVEETAWHSLVAWGKLAEKVGQTLKCGDKISITGRINNRTYTNKEGEKRVFTEIVMRSLDFIAPAEASSSI